MRKSSLYLQLIYEQLGNVSYSWSGIFRKGGQWANDSAWMGNRIVVFSFLPLFFSSFGLLFLAVLCKEASFLNCMLCGSPSSWGRNNLSLGFCICFYFILKKDQDWELGGTKAKLKAVAGSQLYVACLDWLCVIMMLNYWDVYIAIFTLHF